MNNKEDEEILRRFANGKSIEYEALIRVVNFHLTDLVDITNIDLEKNVGLQACGRANAFIFLKKIFTDLTFAPMELPRKRESYN